MGRFTIADQHLFLPERDLPLGKAIWRDAAEMTRASILSLAEQHAKADGFFALTVVPRYSEADPATLYEDLGRMLLQVASRSSQREQGLTILKLVDVDRQLAGHVALCPGRFDGVWLLMTDMKRSSAEYRHLVDPVLQLMASRAPGAWLPTADMQAVLYDLQDRVGIPLTPGKVISSNRERSSIEYMKKRRSLADVFGELKERELVLRSLDFAAVGRGSRIALAAGIDKWMRLKYRGGSYVPFDEYLVSAVEARLRQHVRKLTVGREDALSGNPIVFRFTREVLTNRSRNQELVNTLASLPNVSVCTFHINPYLHVALVDYSDGSNMDIFADDPQTLAVIPGKRCSVGAVSRAFNRVYAHFASGEIADLEKISTGGGASGF